MKVASAPLFFLSVMAAVSCGQDKDLLANFSFEPLQQAMSEAFLSDGLIRGYDLELAFDSGKPFEVVAIVPDDPEKRRSLAELIIDETLMPLWEVEHPHPAIEVFYLKFLPIREHPPETSTKRAEYIERLLIPVPKGSKLLITSLLEEGDIPLEQGDVVFRVKLREVDYDIAVTSYAIVSPDGRPKYEFYILLSVVLEEQLNTK